MLVLVLSGGLIFGFKWGAVITSFAATVSAAVDFLAGRYAFRRKVSEIILKNRKLRALDQAVDCEGGKIILLSRLTAIAPFVVINAFWGVTCVRFNTYLWATWAGMLPGILLYVYLGSVAPDLPHIFQSGGRQPVFLILSILAAFAILILVTRRAGKILKETTE